MDGSHQQARRMSTVSMNTQNSTDSVNSEVRRLSFSSVIEFVEPDSAKVRDVASGGNAMDAHLPGRSLKKSAALASTSNDADDTDEDDDAVNDHAEQVLSCTLGIWESRRLRRSTAPRIDAEFVSELPVPVQSRLWQRRHSE